MNLLAENVTICYRICFYPTEASSACSIGIGRAAVGIDIRFHRVVRRVQSRPIILEETRVCNRDPIYKISYDNLTIILR